MLKPPKLTKGDRVALVAPASGFDREAFFRGKKNLENMGFEVVHRQDVFDRTDYLAGSDERRRDELEEAMSDESIKGVICVRGGYGTLRLLPMLRWERFAPKIFVGCSDITTLVNIIASRLGFVSFHGPMLAGEYGISDDSEAAENLFAMLTGKFKYPLSYESADFTTLSGGGAEGRLLGGCLSLLIALLGTTWDFDYSGCILFIEDIAEPAYRIDRMLSQLILAGKLSNVRGIVFGEMTRCGGCSVKDVIAKKLAHLKVPILYGLRSGHSNFSVTLPLGLPVILDANNKKLKIPHNPINI